MILSTNENTQYNTYLFINCYNEFFFIADIHRGILRKHKVSADQPLVFRTGKFIIGPLNKTTTLAHKYLQKLARLHHFT